MKQAIILRKDLGMKPGKLCAQASHASLSSFLKTKKYERLEWILGGQKKVVLKVKSLRELKVLEKMAKKEKISHNLIKDAGLTQLKRPTITSLGIGPASDEKIDKITGKLKLL